MNKTYENFEEWLKEHDEEVIRKFAEWIECNGFKYNKVGAFWYRTHFDRENFAEEVYTTNELLNLYGKEQNNE